MFFKNLFKKKEKDRSNLELKDILPGDILDYDMKTWKVVAKNKYDWDGDFTYEWQLKTSDDMIFLELEDEETDEYSASRKIKNSDIDTKVFEQISETDESPEKINVDGKDFYLDEVVPGLFIKNCQDTNEEPFVSFYYISADGSEFITIEQWDERSFEVSKGFQVFEYQFTNILPGTK